MASWYINGNKDNPIEIGGNYLKVAVVGEPGVGKTTFIRTLVQNNFREEEISINGARVYRCHFKIGDTLRRIAFYEIPSHPGFTWQHKFPHYDRANIFIFMYAVHDPASFSMLAAKWIIETLPVISLKKLPVAVIGNKRDLRNNSQVIEHLALNNQSFVTPDQVVELFDFALNGFSTGEVSSLVENEVVQAFKNIGNLAQVMAPIVFRSRL